MTLFEFEDFRPDWATECVYCRLLPSGRWSSRAEHDRDHLPVRCERCGAVSANRTSHDRDHGRGGLTWTRFGDTRPICISLQLRINQGRLDPAPYLLAMEETA